VITGANSGIGKAAAVALAKMGLNLVLVCRDRERGERAVSEVRESGGKGSVDLEVADLSSLEAVRGLAEDIRERHPETNVLVNNAGLATLRRTVTPEGYETTFAVNYLAPFLLTNLLLDVLKANAPSRIVNVASDAHYSGHVRFDDLQGERGFNGLGAYAQSKLALVLFTKELASRLKGTGVTANCLHPGVVATNVWNRGAGPFGFIMALPKLFLISPERGAETVVYLATSPEVKESGEYFEKKRVKRSSAESYDTKEAQRLWDISLQLTHLEGPLQAA
jgi:NAD(P)-dependent dehydrogenase (short-subunit alcohol dehydrogenase family)